MGRLALLLLALCLVPRTCSNQLSDDEDLVEGYREVRETLREIFDRGVDYEKQEQRDASSASLLETSEGMALCDLYYITIKMFTT